MGERSFYETFLFYSDENLIEIITNKRDEFAPEAVAAAEEILKNRGFEIEVREADSEEPESRPTNSSPPSLDLDLTNSAILDTFQAPPKPVQPVTGGTSAATGLLLVAIFAGIVFLGSTAAMIGLGAPILALQVLISLALFIAALYYRGVVLKRGR